MQNNYILSLGEVTQDDISVCGGKGASLGELINAGFPVPSGFVVTTEVFKKFRKQEFPEDFKKQIYNAFDGLGASSVAVRSSAVAEDSPKASWAGQLETYLNIERDDLIDRIRDCWNSIHSERALAYAAQQNVSEEQLLVAVVVQKMVDSEIAGVIFTVNPVTKDPNEIMIEAAPGLGEAIVQGEITPDNFVIEKGSFSVKSRDINASSGLTDLRLKELAEIGVRIENHYGFPQDIEWAQDDSGKIWILQSRPITTL